MKTERRKAERKPLYQICTYTINGCDHVDLSTNISEKGIFIKNANPPELQTPVTIYIKLSNTLGEERIKIHGNVVHVNNAADPHQRGIGIEFTSVITDSHKMIGYCVREVFNQHNRSRAKLDNPQAMSAHS